MSYSMFTLISLFLILGAHILPALAGSCLSRLRDSQGDSSYDAQWAKCKTHPKQWACEHPSITFPTVDCLKEDMRTCGIVGTGPSIFYSFGATTTQARENLRDKLNPKGVMYNDALDRKYFIKVLEGREQFKLGQQNRMQVFRDRYAQALAEVAKDEVFMVMLNYNGEFGGTGIYQNSREGEPANVWTKIELPTLQKNRQVRKITSVSVSDGYKHHVDWQPGKGRVLPFQDTRQTPVPAPQPGKRDANQCTLDETEDNEECEE